MYKDNMDLGEHYPCLNVKNLAASIDFYTRLGFTMLEDHSAENWAILQHNNMVVCLFQEIIENNLINFRGGDIEAIVTQAEENGLAFSQPATQEVDGSWSAEIVDPDGNHIYFNTFADEREQYVKTGRLIDY